MFFIDRDVFIAVLSKELCPVFLESGISWGSWAVVRKSYFRSSSLVELLRPTHMP